MNPGEAIAETEFRHDRPAGMPFEADAILFPFADLYRLPAAFFTGGAAFVRNAGVSIVTFGGLLLGTSFAAVSISDFLLVSGIRQTGKRQGARSFGPKPGFVPGPVGYVALTVFPAETEMGRSQQARVVVPFDSS